MGFLLRTVLIWLVALAVPAHGMAAATMLHCGPAHNGARAAKLEFQAFPDALHMAPGEDAAHRHASHHAPDPRMASDPGQNVIWPDASGAEQADKGIEDVKVAKVAKVAKVTYQKGSACTSCCAGLALSGTAIILPRIEAIYEITTWSSSMATSVVVDRPERPPRILRA